VKRLVFVASPYRADTQESMLKNKNYIIDFMRKLWTNKGEVGFAPHAYFPQFLSDLNEEQRTAGIECGIAVMKVCQRMYVVGSIITEGMEDEIKAAKQIGLDIIYVPNPDIFFSRFF